MLKLQCLAFLIFPALCAAYSVKYVPVDEGGTHLEKQETKYQAEDFQPNSRWSSAGLLKEDQAAWLATSGAKSKVMRGKVSEKRNPKFWQENGVNELWMSSQVKKELREAHTHRRSKTKVNENLMEALHGLDDALLSIGEVQKDSNSKAGLKNGKVARSPRRHRRAAELKGTSGDAGKSKTLGALQSLEKMLGVVEKDKEAVEQVAKVKEAAKKVTSALEFVEEDEEDQIVEAIAMLQFAEDELEQIAEGLQSSGREVLHHKDFDKFLHGGLQHSKITKRSAREKNLDPQNLIKKGLTPTELAWLEEEFSITKDEVEAVQALPDSDFEELVGQLREEDQSGYNMEGLVDMLSEARHLVGFGVGAAASGVAHLGRPVYSKVTSWASDGGELAAGYVGPRLKQLGASVYSLQERLGKVAKDVGPQVVPALQAVVEELGEALHLTSQVIGNTVDAVGDEVSPIYERVRNKAMEQPSYRKLSVKAAAATDMVGEGLSSMVEGGKVGATKLGSVMKHKVAPAVKKIFERVMSGTKGAAKAVQGKYKEYKKSMRSPSVDPEQSL